jgi:RNA-binding protein Musashi
MQIDPKRAIPRSAHQRAQRFFIGGLSPTSTAESLRAFFDPFGKVIDLNVMMDRDTGRNKGFAFVTFEDLDDSGVDTLVSGGGTGGGWEIDGKVVSKYIHSFFMRCFGKGGIFTKR